MIEIPTLQESKQTIYSAIPLVLNTSTATINEYHQQKTQVHSSDCLIISQNEMPNECFRYYNTTIPILYNDSLHISTTKKQTHNKYPITPFTSLLVGPSYTCHALMQNYFQWAILQPHLFSSPTIDKKQSIKKTTIQKTHRYAKHHHKMVWKETIIPKVWAQATISHVKTTCMLGNALQDELRNIFNYPITVSAVSPPNNNTHNEIFAWLFTIYAITIARKIFRTVVCDSSAIEHQFQSWQLQEKTAFHPLNNIINIHKKTSTPCSLLSIKQHRENMFINNNKKNSISIKKINVKQQVLNISEYHKRKTIYSTIHHPACKKYIGFSSQHITQSLIIAKKYVSLDQDIISIEIHNTNIYISLPLLLCIQTQEDIKILVSHLLKHEINNIIIQTCFLKINPLYLHLNRYDIMTNLVFLACKKLKKNKKTKAKAKLTLKDIAKLTLESSIALCLELEVFLYSKKISISTVNVAIHTGYIINDKKILGILEYKIINALYSLLGTKCLYNKKRLHWNIKLLKNKTSTYDILSQYSSTASFPYNFHALVQQAIEDAFSENNTSMLHFPLLEYI